MSKVAVLSPPESPEVVREVQEEALINEKPAAAEPVGRYKSFKIDVWSKFLERQLKGTFVNDILTPRMNITVGSVKSQLLAGASATTLDGGTQVTAEKIAHLSVSLSEKPDWFEPQSFEDSKVLELIYQEAASHEATFWGSEPD